MADDGHIVTEGPLLKGADAARRWSEELKSHRLDVNEDEYAAGFKSEDEYVETYHESSEGERLLYHIERSFETDGRIVIDGKALGPDDFTWNDSGNGQDRERRPATIRIGDAAFEPDDVEEIQEHGGRAFLVFRHDQRDIVIEPHGETAEEIAEKARIRAEERAAREETAAAMREMRPEKHRQGPPHVMRLTPEMTRPAPSSGTLGYDELRAGAAKSIETRRRNAEAKAERERQETLQREEARAQAVRDRPPTREEAQRRERAEAFASTPRGRRILAERMARGLA